MDFENWKSYAKETQNKIADRQNNMDFEKWTSSVQTYAADTLQNIKNLDDLAEQDEYIKSDGLNVTKAKKQSSSDDKKEENTITAKKSRDTNDDDKSDRSALNPFSGVVSKENEIISTCSSSSSFLDEKLSLKISQTDDQDSEPKPAEILPKPIPIGNVDINKKVLLSTAMKEMVSSARVGADKEDNDWSLLDVPWQASTVIDKTKLRKEDALDLEKAKESTIEQKSKKESTSSSNDTMKRTQQMSMLSVVASLMQEISSPDEVEQPKKTPKPRNKTKKTSIEDKMNLSSDFMKTLDIYDRDDFSSDDEEYQDNFETDKLLNVTSTIATPTISSKKGKTTWFDVFDENNNNSLLFNSVDESASSSSPLNSFPTTPTTDNTSFIKNIPFFQKIAQNKTVQSLTQSLANVRPKAMNSNQVAQHQQMQPLQSSSDSTTSSEDMYLASSSVMNLEDSLEWQRLQRQNSMHPVNILRNKLSACLKKYGFVLFTLCVALFVYFYSRKKVIDRVA